MTTESRQLAVAAAIASLTACMQPQAPELELASCPIHGTGEFARCGTLEVPENWEQPDGKRIALNVMVIPALDPSGAAPLFDLAGGPGVAATMGADFYATAGRATRQVRDVVLIDQRGTGKSAPLHCAKLEAAPPVLRMYPPEDVRSCRDDLAARHDLTQYTTQAAVRDLEAVRAALGAERIDLFGISYGTRLGQAYIRAYPDRVHAAAFLGTVPIDLRTPLYHASSAEQTLKDIFSDCASDAACAAAYPRLTEDWQAVVARFDQGAVSMSFGTKTFEVERGPFMESLRATMTTDAGQRRLPAVVHAAAGGDFAPFAEVVGMGGGPSLAEGLYLSIECSEGATRIAEEEIATATAGTFLGRYRVDEQLGACREWPQRDLPEAFFAPVSAAVPVLFLAGNRDHVAPPAYAETVARGFADSRVVLIEEMPHFPVEMANLECLDMMLLEFYAAGDPSKVDAGCAATMKARPFK